MDTDRLVQYYSPTLHYIIRGVLSAFAKPRKTPLADSYVLGAASHGSNPAETMVAPFTLLSRLHEAKLKPEEEKYWRPVEQVEIAAECLDHMAAGIDTTGDVLCFLMWELSQPRSMAIQRMLQEELCAAGIHDSEANPGLDKLPFLDAVVTEGLRCFPAIPMSLPRYVPPGGRIIDGHEVPEATIVSCQAYSVQRLDATVFPEPDAFLPDRWLQPEGKADRRKLQFAFSGGGRGCIGKQ